MEKAWQSNEKWERGGPQVSRERFYSIESPHLSRTDTSLEQKLQEGVGHLCNHRCSIFCPTDRETLDLILAFKITELKISDSFKIWLQKPDERALLYFSMNLKVVKYLIH